MQVNQIKAIYWRIEECRAPCNSMQSGLLEFEHFLVFAWYSKHCHHCNEFSRIEMHCWIEMQSVLPEFLKLTALHRITDICRPPSNAFSGIASCCVALWNTRPLTFFNIVNRSSGIMLHCINVELSYLPTSGGPPPPPLNTCCAANMPLTALKTFQKPPPKHCIEQTSAELGSRLLGQVGSARSRLCSKIPQKLIQTFPFSWRVLLILQTPALSYVCQTRAGEGPLETG